MITQDSVLVQLIRLIERIPSPPPPRRRGRPFVYSEKLFLKVLVIMIVRRLHKVGELLAVLDEPTPEMRMVRELLLCEKGRFPARRTFDRRMRALPDEARFVLGDPHYDAENVCEKCEQTERFLDTSKRGAYPHTDSGVEVRRIFHKLRSLPNENFNEHFKSIFDVHEQVPTKGRVNTTRFALGAVFVYQLALLHRHERKSEGNRGLKRFLRAA
jgi:hypothetical protein